MPLDLTPYAGRWVALLGDQVAGMGFTAVAAEQAARHNRPRDKFVIRFVEEAGGQALLLPDLLAALRPLLAQETQAIYLVGGSVRDALLGRASHDLDFVVAQDAIKLAFQVADSLGVPAYVLDKERDAGRVILPDNKTFLDFTRFRGANLEDDLRGRDFTINAIAMPATAVTTTSLIDPCHGRADLQNKLIRLTHDTALHDDPVRVLRALRLALNLNFELTAETKTAVQQTAPHLKQSSMERLRDEFLKLLQHPQPATAVRLLHEQKVLPHLLPDIAALEDVTQSPPHQEDVLHHTLSVLHWLALLEQALLPDGQVSDPALTAVRTEFVDYLADLQSHWQQVVDGGLDGRLLLRLGALFHDVGKKETRTVEADGRVRFFNHDVVGTDICGAQLHQLKLSNQAITIIRRIVRHHMRPLLLSYSQVKLSRRAVYRYFKTIGPTGLDIGLLSLVDHLAAYQGIGDEVAWQRLLQVVSQLFAHYFTRYEETVAPPLLVDGRDLMQEFQLKQGPEIGRLLRLIQEAQATGEVQTREQALQFAHACRQ